MAEFKQENLLKLFNNTKNIRNKIYDVLSSLPGFGRRSDIGYMVHEMYVQMYGIISELNHIVEFRVIDYDIFAILKKFQGVYKKLNEYSKIFETSGQEEQCEVAKQFREISESLKSYLDMFKMDELKMDEIESKEGSKVSKKLQCKFNCPNYLKKHCEKFTHSI